MWYWIVFNDGDNFLGATIVNGKNELEALKETVMAGINQGGSAQIATMPHRSKWPNNIPIYTRLTASEMDTIVKAFTELNEV